MANSPRLDAQITPDHNEPHQPQEGEEYVAFEEDDIVEEFELDQDDLGEPMDDDEFEAQMADLVREEVEDTSIFRFRSHHPEPVYALAVRPGSTDNQGVVTIASGGGDDKAYIFTFTPGAVSAEQASSEQAQDGEESGEQNAGAGELVAELTGHTDSVTTVEWSKDGKYLATAGMDGRIKVWKEAEGGSDVKWDLAVEFAEMQEVQWLAWHPRGPVLAAGSDDGTVYMWQIPSGRQMNIFTGHADPSTCGQFTPDGRYLLSASGTVLLLHNPRNSTPKFTLPTASLNASIAPHANLNLPDGIVSLTVNSKGTLAAVGGASGGLRIVRLVTEPGLPGEGAEIVDMRVVSALEGHVMPPKPAGVPRQVRNEDGDAMQEDEEEPEPYSIEALAFIPPLALAATAGRGAGAATGKNDVLLSAGTDGRLLAWEEGTWRVREGGRHEDAITTLASHFLVSSSEPHLVTTASADRSLKTFDLRTGKVLGVYTGSEEVVHCVGLSNDAKWIVGAGDDGIVRVWAAGSGAGVAAGVAGAQ